MPKKILLVDDDISLCHELAEILTGEGYYVDTITDSKKAALSVRQKAYDLYILDYKMEGLTGIGLLKIIKEKDSRRPVILITGRPFIDKLLQEEALAQQISLVISKPFDIEDLLQKIKNLF